MSSVSREFVTGIATQIETASNADRLGLRCGPVERRPVPTWRPEELISRPRVNVFAGPELRVIKTRSTIRHDLKIGVGVSFKIDRDETGNFPLDSIETIEQFGANLATLLQGESWSSNEAPALRVEMPQQFDPERLIEGIWQAVLLCDYFAIRTFRGLP